MRGDNYMEERNETTVDEIIDDLLDELNTTDPTTEEYKKVSEQLTVLSKVKNEQKKLKLEMDEAKRDYCYAHLLADRVTMVIGSLSPHLYPLCSSLHLRRVFASLNVPIQN